MLSKFNIIELFQLAYIILYFKFCERSKLDVSLHFHGEDQFLYHAGRMRSKLYRGEQVKYQVIFTDTTFLERDVPRGKQDLERMKNSKTWHSVSMELSAQVYFKHTKPTHEE